MWNTSLQRAKTPVQGCPGYDIKQPDRDVPVMLEPWGNAKYSFITTAPRFTRVLSRGQIELFDI